MLLGAVLDGLDVALEGKGLVAAFVFCPGVRCGCLGLLVLVLVLAPVLEVSLRKSSQKLR